MVNNVVLIGRLARDPESRTTTTAKNVCSFSIAVQKRVKPQDGSPDADFFDIVAWERQADYVTNYLSKGRLVAVEGRLQSRKFTASDQSQRTVVEIVATNVQGLDRPRDDDRQGDQRPVSEYQNQGIPTDSDYDPFLDS